MTNTTNNTNTTLSKKQLTKLSKFLSLILRHKPEEINLTLDANGYADVNQLITLINTNSEYHITHTILDTIVSTDEKQRYSYNTLKMLI